MNKLLLIFVQFLLSIAFWGHLEAQFTWTNGNGNGFLDQAGNWNPAVVPNNPAATATFPSLPAIPASNHTPTISTFTSFSLGEAIITDPTTPYHFDISTGGAIVQFQFNFSQTGSTNTATGVLNSTSLTQRFTISDSATGSSALIFSGASSANINPSNTTGNVIYNVLSSNSGANSLVFRDNSTASNAIINAPSVNNQAIIEFQGASDPSQAIISLHGISQLNFLTATKSSHGGPFITLFDSSMMNLVVFSNRIASLKSSSTTTQVNFIGTPTLTIRQPSGQHDVYAGEINGNGTFNLNDVDSTSTLRLTGDNCTNFTGTTNIKQGQLILDGSLGGQINVFDILSGTGTACNTVDVKRGGVIFPGDNDRIGTLTVGEYINENGGSYLTLVNGNGNSSLIRATTSNTNGPGTVTLRGGKVIAASSNGTFLIGTPYRIVHAQNGVTGQYNKAVQIISPFLVPKLTYDPLNVFLTLKTNFAGFAGSGNQGEVAEQIDSIRNPSAALQAFLQALVTLTPGQLRQTLAELSGVQYTSIFPTFEKATERFIRGLNVPMRLRLAECCEENCNCFELWGNALWGRSFVSCNEGYKQQNIHGLIATQMKLCCDSTIGAAVFYENDILHFHLNGKARNHIVLGSVFGVYRHPCFYFLSDFIGGYFRGHYRRHIHIGDIIELRTLSHPKAYNGTYYGELGSTYCDCCGVGIQTFLGAEAGWYHIERFEETEGIIVNLRGRSQYFRTVDSFLGLRLATSIFCVDIIGEGAWQHSYTPWGNHIKLKFVDFGDDFRIRGQRQNRDGFVGTLTLALEACDDLRFFFEAYGERWKHYTTYSVGFGLDVLW